MISIKISPVSRKRSLFHCFICNTRVKRLEKRIAKIKKVQSLYIHFPFCRHLCNYCDFHKKIPQSQSEVKDYEKLLKNHFDQNIRFLSRHNFEIQNLKTIYIGGGTPSLWGPDGIQFVNKLLDENEINIEPGLEFTLELNPGSWKKDDISSFKELGVNRLSVGVQSMSADILKLLDRVHSLDQVHETLNLISKSGFNFSVDFMLGLPQSNVPVKRNITKEIEEINIYHPNHLSAYILTVAKSYLHYSRLPDDDFISDEYMVLSEQMQKKGFDHYEVSNFSKSGFSAKHNLQYWRSQSVAAIGPSATGFLNLGGSGVRYKWGTSAGKVKHSEEIITSDELKVEKFFLSMRINEGTNLNHYIGASNMSEATKFIAELNLGGHLDNATVEQLTLSPKGFLCADSIITRLLSLF